MSIDYKNLFRFGYYGDDIHILRNSTAVTPVPVDIKSFFVVPTGYTLNILSYTMPGSIGVNNSNPYDNIEITTDDKIVCKPHSGTAAAKIRTLFANINLVNTTTTSTDLSLRVKIHIHDSIDNVWLTPDQLSIYNNLSETKFGVYVRFSDGVIANVTGYPGLTWARHASLNGIVSIDPATGYVTIVSTSTITLPYNNANSLITVTLPDTLKNSGGSAFTASARLIIKDSLSTVTPVPIGTVLSTNDRLNALILPDGFAAADSALFTTYANQLEAQFREPYSSPYNYLSANMNFWSLFVPSEEDGGSLIDDHVFIATNATNSAQSDFLSYKQYVYICNNVITEFNSSGPGGLNSVRAAVQLNSPALDTYLNNRGDWNLVSSSFTSTPSTCYTLHELIGKLGHPSIDDYNAAGTMAARLTAHQTEWNKINNPLFDYTRINAFTYSLWLNLARVRALDRKDTVFGLFRGEAPKFLQNVPFSAADGYEMSAFVIKNKTDLNRALGGLTYNGQNLGANFFDATSGSVHKDGNYIIIISKIPITLVKGNLVPNADGKYLFTPAFDPGGSWDITCDNLTVGSSGNTRYKPIAKSRTPLQLRELTTAVHEFSHNFLSDEYSLGYNFPVPSQGSALYNAENIQNVQFREDLENASNQLVADNIRWRWPRITKVGIFSMSLSNAAHPTYTVTCNDFYPNLFLSVPHPDRFQEQEFVLLRGRDLYAAHTYPVFKIVNINGNTFTLLHQSGTVNVSEFASGGLIIGPRWISPIVFTYQQLVHNSVVSLIDTSNQPQIASDTDPYKRPQVPTNIPAFATYTPSPTFKIVGLYAGGVSKYNTGVYHPTGFCMMRNNINNTTVPQTANAFCPVCKYILVDLINPLCHPLIDNDYQPDYPQP